jgi:hypothetical protein
MARLAIVLSVALALLALSSPLGRSLASAAECKAVRGHQEEVQVAGPECASPVGLCTIARLFGALKGDARFSATTISSSIDTPLTGVVFVTGDTVLEGAALGGRQGTLLIKNAAAFRTTDDGDLSDTQVILGGSGDFVGATGSLRISGTFVAGSGSASYEGTVCVP